MIKINSDFEMERDTYCWMLHEWKDGLSKKKEPIRTKRTTYHANLEQVCSTVIDRSAGKADDLNGVVLMIKMATSDLSKAISAIKTEDS